MGRRRFTREFKIEAVRRVLESDLTMAAVAKELGVGSGLLGIWKKEFGEEASVGLPGKPGSREAEEHLRRLERKIRGLEQENAFLKKTASYFARAEQSGSRRS